MTFLRVPLGASDFSDKCKLSLESLIIAILMRLGSLYLR